MENKKYSVVTTGKRGVFFGKVTDRNEERDSLVLLEAQMCVYWDVSVRGVLGLASDGPNEICRITKVIPSIELNEITSIMECTDQAVQNWKQCFWRE